ncbi:MAG: hypothetical protein F7C33_00860 [Desulfurococcales archaeon]|nr:hypothetical protein [Desulfurococcales archaeon]
MLKIRIPLKVTANRAKTIAGPYTHLKDNVYLLLSLVSTGATVRWEPHLLVDRMGLLDREGISVATGPVVLVNYEGDRRRLLEELQAILGRVYIPPWGFPLILVFETSPPSNEVMMALHIAGSEKASRALRLLKERLSIEIV